MRMRKNIRRKRQNGSANRFWRYILILWKGICAADPEEVKHLVDGQGYFNITWWDLFHWNYSPKKFMTIKKELKAEIKAQTERFREKFGEDLPLRFDGHQHTQMIPLCYWALLEVIVEQHYRTAYIRITKEPIMPYLRQVSYGKATDQ